jgi:hypothetical protein
MSTNETPRLTFKFLLEFSLQDYWLTKESSHYAFFGASVLEDIVRQG